MQGTLLLHVLTLVISSSCLLFWSPRLKTNNPSTGVVSRPFVDAFKRASQCIKSSNSATIRGKSLRLLGKLACAYPRHMEEEAPNVLAFCLAILFKVTLSTLKDSGVEAAGSIDGLRYLLEHFDYLLLHPNDNEEAEKEEEEGGGGSTVTTQSNINNNANNVDQLYGVVFRTSIVNITAMKRYQIPEAALLFIASHGRMFAAQMQQESGVLFRRVCRCFVCKPIRVNQAAVGATKCVLNVLSNYIMGEEEAEGAEGAEEERAKKKQLYTTMYGYLQELLHKGSRATFLTVETSQDGTTPLHRNDVGNAGVEKRCRELAVLGLGGLAGPIGKYEGTKGLKASLHRMLLLASGGQEEQEEREGQEDQDGDAVMHNNGASSSSSSSSSSSPSSSSSSSASGASLVTSRWKYRWMKTRLLEACSHTMLHVPKGTQMNDIMHAITSLVSELMLTYHEMNRYMKHDVQRTLNQIMVSCMCNQRHSHLLKQMLDAVVDSVLVQTTTQSVAGSSNNNSQTVPRYHPVTGLPETRLAFEYVGLWLSMTRTSDVLASVKLGRMAVPPKEKDEEEEEEEEEEEDIVDDAVHRADLALSLGASDTATCVFDTMVSRCLHLITRLRLGEKTKVDPKGIARLNVDPTTTLVC